MKFNNLQSNQSNNTHNASFAPNTAADANQQQPGAHPQAAPVQPLESAADLANHPAARHLQAYHSIRSGKPGAVDSLSQQETLKVLEDILREEQYKMLSVEEKNRVITAAVQFINTVRIEAKPYEKVTLFIGQTGAGKSTLINYLAGAEIKGKWSEDLNAVALDIPNMLKDISVGHGAASCTFAPMPYEDTARGLVYFDCPGFMDSRGILHEIIAAKLIQDVIRNAKQVNFVVTITESCLSDRGHIRVLKETIDVLETYAPDFEASKNSMLLVVTKGANDKNYGDPGDEADDSRYFKAKVAGKSGILNELDQELSGYQKAFLTFIHTADRFTYSFKADIKKDTPVSTVERGRIIQKIQELELVPHQEILGIKISDHAQLRSIELAEHINTCLEGLHRQIAETAFKSIADFCSQKVGACEDLFDQDLAALQTMLKNLHQTVIPLGNKQYDTAEAFFKDLQAVLTTNNISVAENSLQAIHAILADIKGHESAQLLFRKICPSNRESSSTKLIFTQGLIPLYQTLKSLIQTCARLQDYQPIKPGLPYMEKLEDEAVNAAKVEMLLKHAQDHEKLGHFQDAEEAYGKLLKYTESAEHYKLYAGCLKEISLKLSSALPKDEAQEKAYREKASRAFYYLGQLYIKQGALEDAKNAYKASCDLALHEAALQALLDVARRLEETAEVAAALEKLAAFYEQKGAIALAIDKLKEAFQVVKSARLLEKLEVLYKQEGGDDSQSQIHEIAILRFELQISQDPNNIEAYRDYGWFLKSIGKHNEARAVKKRIDVQLQAIQRELFQGLQENLQALQQKVVKQKTKIGGLKQTIQSQDEKIHSQAGKLETLEKQVQGSATGSNIAIDNLQKRVEIFEKEKLPEQINRLNALETVQLSEQAKSIRTLNTQLETLKGQVQTNTTGTKGAIDGLKNQLVSLEKEKLPEQTKRLDLTISDFNKKISSQTQDIASLQGNILSLEKEKLPEQAKSIQSLNTQLETLDKQVKTNTTGTKGAIDGLQKRLVAVETVKLPEQIQVGNLNNLNIRVEFLEKHGPHLYFKAPTNIQDVSFLNKKPYIKFLNLEGCNQISDLSLQHLAGRTQLISLNLRGCYQISNASLQHLAGLTQLSFLDLRECNQITDLSLQYLAGLTQLKELNLSRCCNFTNAGLQYIAGLTQLSFLNLCNCSQLTNAGLQHLAGLTQLSFLDLDGCSQLTDGGLQHLRGLTQLSTLDLSYCSKITSNAKAQLKKQIPGLNIIG